MEDLRGRRDELLSELQRIDAALAAADPAGESARAVSAAALSDLFHTSPVAMMATRCADGVPVAVNDACVRLFAHADEQEFCREFRLTLHEGAVGKHRRTWERLLERAVISDWESRWQRNDGTIFWAQATVRVSQDRQHLESVLIDITQRRAAQAALEDSEARFRTLVEHAPEAMVILDAETQRFVGANENARRLFGLSQEELLAVGPADVSPELAPDGRRTMDVAAAMIGEALAGGSPVFEWVHLRSTGEAVPCEVRLVRLPDPLRQLVRGSIIDISERKRQTAEQARLGAQLRQAQKMEAVGQLTGGVAHDFNNLLTVIIGNLSVLAESLDDADHREMCQEALDASDRAAELIRRLLAFSRKQPLVPRAVDAFALAQHVSILLRRTLGETITIETLESGERWKCEADPAQLENSLLNLAINARDAMPTGGRLLIETAGVRIEPADVEAHDGVAPGEYVMLAVTDDGCGMPADVVERVFEPFFSTKPTGSGTGLGLSMVHGFVKQSGGHVKVYSEPGRGTSVKLYLRRAAPGLPEAARSPGADEGIPAGCGELVLVVEDEPAVRTLAQRVLEGCGYNVLVAGDALAALQLLDAHDDVALLLTDIVLPGGMSGVELAQEARTHRPELRVLFASGYTKNAVIHHGRLDPGVELLQKPFGKAQLARRVRAVLDAADDSPSKG